MGIAYHTLYAPDGTAPNLFDRVVLGVVTATYGASSSAGVAATATVTWSEPIPTTYTVLMSPVEDSNYWVTAKTTIGFTLNVSPRLAASSLTGSAVQVVILS